MWQRLQPQPLTCKVASCSAPVFVDGRTGKVHEFCSRSHGQLFKQQSQLLNVSYARTQGAGNNSSRSALNASGCNGTMVTAVEQPMHNRNAFPTQFNTGAGSTQASMQTIQQGFGSLSTGQHPHGGGTHTFVPSGLLPTGGRGVGGVSRPVSAATAPRTPTLQGSRVTDTMVLFWKPPCVFTQWEPAAFTVDNVSGSTGEHILQSTVFKKLHRVLLVLCTVVNYEKKARVKFAHSKHKRWSRVHLWW